MLENAYICPYCKKDIKGKEILEKTRVYYDGATNLSNAIELFGKGFECKECYCRWYYNGKIFKNGKEELKDKYEIKEIESIEEITEQKELSNENADNINTEAKEESEDKKEDAI